MDVMYKLGDELRELSALRRLRYLCVKICSSPQRRARFRLITQTKYTTSRNERGALVSTLMVIRDVRHCWNSTEAMITRGLLLREAIDAWVFERRELRPLLLSNSDWDLLESLGKLLKLFTAVTLQMSKRSTPTLPWVLPMYDTMLTHLENARDNISYPEVLRVAAGAGLTKLNKYYPKAQANQFNVIATLLHPSLGLGFFAAVDADRATRKQTSWDLVKHATTLFEHAFRSYQRAYDSKKMEAAKSAPPPPVANPSSLTSQIVARVASNSRNEAQPRVTRDELNEFWCAAQVYGAGDAQKPLLWWKEFGTHFPVASRMARDFLVIPGTSVSVERLFSQARNVCQDTRSSLKASTIKEAMLTKMWLKAGYIQL
ncbi:unnamed protein product [Mycena citricolor]|uniref:HAT C-terminal dimerisation domain-containing protein n=1 Tax=Mycena citricolor TaxID=2018698 RepID=A0AAD2Q7N1_9AGAR|nr:unnamed protein product [Mycena citricolor]